MGTIERRLAWALCKDDMHNSRSAKWKDTLKPETLKMG